MGLIRQLVDVLSPSSDAMAMYDHLHRHTGLAVA